MTFVYGFLPMNCKMIPNKKGFTLLELIVVIIIVGVLASLALPRVFSALELSKSMEAISAIAVIHRSIIRCTMFQAAIDYSQCNEFDEIDIEDPAGTPGSEFSYVISLPGGAVNYRIRATRDDGGGGGGGGCGGGGGGPGDNWIEYDYLSDGAVDKKGNGIFVALY